MWCFLPSFIEIGRVVTEKNIFKIVKYFRYFAIISPWKRLGPLFEQIWIPVTQGCLVLSLVEIGAVVLEKMKMWNIYRQTNGKTDDGQQGIIKAYLRFQLR